MRPAAYPDRRGSLPRSACTTHGVGQGRGWQAGYLLSWVDPQKGQLSLLAFRGVGSDPRSAQKKAPRGQRLRGAGGKVWASAPAIAGLAITGLLLRPSARPKGTHKVCVGRDPSVSLRFLFLRLRPHCCGGRYGTRSAWRRYRVCYPCVSLQRLLRFRLLTGSDDCREASVLV